MAISESAILKSELRWAMVVAAIVAIILGAILYAALAMHINPPSNREYVDPKTLHLSAEFTEENLGTRVDPQGRIVARMITTQFEFVPKCLVLPANRDVTLRFTSPDVIHGILVTGTNVNTMVIPGYVAQVHTRFTKTAIVALLAIMFFRAWTQAGITAFTPIYFNHVLHYTGPEAARGNWAPRWSLLKLEINRCINCFTR